MGYIFVASLQQKGRLTTLRKVMIHVTIGKQASLLPYLKAAAYFVGGRTYKQPLVENLRAASRDFSVHQSACVFVARQGGCLLNFMLLNVWTQVVPYVLDKNASYLIYSSSSTVPH